MTVINNSGFSLRSIIDNFFQRRREIKVARELLALPDATLRDIGLNRWDIKAAINAGNTMRALARISSENREMYANYGCGRLSGASPDLRMVA
jgi:Domain of unknown function (DUF1127).